MQCNRISGALLALAVGTAALSSCNSDDPVFSAITYPDRISFTAARQYPEGIAYAPTLDRFLVSSLTQGKIGTVDQQGNYADLIRDSLLIAAVGLKVQNERLYVCHGDLGVSTKTTTTSAMKTAGLYISDLKTGTAIRRVNLATLLPTANHYANDLALDAQGNAYVTDSFSPVIYRVPADASLPATVLVNSTRFQGEGFNLNGIVWHPDNYLIVAKANEGKLFKVNLNQSNAITEVTGVSLPGGDGMVLYNNVLYVVNNRNRVSQVRSTDGWATASLVKTDSTGYDQTTTNTVLNGQIYSLNARIGETSAAAMAKNPALLQASGYSIQRFK